MPNKFQNPNLVIKNGVYLLLRMLLVLFLGFFATRLTLQVLGDEKFGIYNIVGGIIAVFAIISMPVRDSLQRFFNVEYANENYLPSTVFHTSSRIVWLMVAVIIVLYETIGVYIINYVIQYPIVERLAVNIIFQISALTSVFGFIELPYVSLLFSRENMSIPAVCEIVGAVLKILLLYCIVYIPVDVLIPYSCIFLIINGGRYTFYRSYCGKNYEECFIEGNSDKTLRQKMLGFSGWSFIEAVAGISLTYLSNVFINVFGGVLYNTAYGISKQVQNAVVSFTTNVVKAAEPQITCGTAINNTKYRDQLLMTTVKVSFLVIAFVYIVIHFDGHLLLGLWLGNIPKYAVDFCDIMMLSIVFSSISLPFRTLIMATGKVKEYFSAYGIVSLIAMILMFVLLKIGYPIITVLYLILSSSAVMLIIGVVCSYKVASIDLKIVTIDITKTSTVLLIIALIYYGVRNSACSDIWGFILSLSVSFIIAAILSYYIVLNRAERMKVKEIIEKIKKSK